MRNGSPVTCHCGINLTEDGDQARKATLGGRTVLDSTKILVAPNGVALPSDVRSGEAPMTQILYLKSLIELLVCRFDYIIICENCEAGIG